MQTIRQAERAMLRDPQDPHAMMLYYRLLWRCSEWQRRKVDIRLSARDPRRTAPRIVDVLVANGIRLFAVFPSQFNRKLWTLSHVPSGVAIRQKLTTKSEALDCLQDLLSKSVCDWLRLTYESSLVDPFHPSISEVLKDTVE